MTPVATREAVQAGTCSAPLVQGGYCGRRGRRTCEAVAFPRAGGRLVCGMDLCGALDCRRSHAATNHGQASADRVEDWRRLRRRSDAQKRAFHGAARGRGTGL